MARGVCGRNCTGILFSFDVRTSENGVDSYIVEESVEGGRGIEYAKVTEGSGAVGVG